MLNEGFESHSVFLYGFLSVLSKMNITLGYELRSGSLILSGPAK